MRSCLAPDRRKLCCWHHLALHPLIQVDERCGRGRHGRGRRGGGESQEAIASPPTAQFDHIQPASKPCIRSRRQPKKSTTKLTECTLQRNHHPRRRASAGARRQPDQKPQRERRRQVHRLCHLTGQANFCVSSQGIKTRRGRKPDPKKKKNA